MNRNAGWPDDGCNRPEHVDEIANKLDGNTSDEVTLLDARKSLEFVTAVYQSSRQNINIKLPIDKDNPFYNSWLPKT